MIDPKLNRYYSETRALQMLLDTSRFFSVLMKAYHDKIPAPIYEPCAGSGSISGGLKEMGYNVVTNDIDPDVETDYKRCHVRDEPLGQRFSAIITNPPYLTYKDKLDKDGNPILNAKGVPKRESDLHAIDFLEASSKHNTRLIAYLVRLNILEPTSNRKEILRSGSINDFDLAEIIVTPRMSFSDDGKKDSMTTCWLVFSHNKYKTKQTPKMLWAEE